MSHVTDDTQETASIGAESCLLEEEELEELEPVPPRSLNGTYILNCLLCFSEGLLMSSVPEISSNNSCLQVPAPRRILAGSGVEHVDTV